VRKEVSGPMYPPPMMRDWARHLLAYEADVAATSLQTESPTVLVFEKLRQGLCPLVGVDGFQVLAARALKLARSQAYRLSEVQVTTEGRLRGFGTLHPQTDSEKDQDNDDGVILITHLFGLFLTFLGPATTQRLVQDVFPHLGVSTEAGISSPFENLLQEVNHLRSVSERLETLADKNPAVGDGLVGISGNIRDIAAILDVFAIIKRRAEEPHESELSSQQTRYVM